MINQSLNQIDFLPPSSLVWLWCWPDEERSLALPLLSSPRSTPPNRLSWDDIRKCDSLQWQLRINLAHKGQGGCLLLIFVWFYLRPLLSPPPPAFPGTSLNVPSPPISCTKTIRLVKRMVVRIMILEMVLMSMLVWINNDWVNYHDIGDDHGNTEMLSPPSSPPLLPASPEKDCDCCTNEGILACRKVQFDIEKNKYLVVNIKLWISILKEYKNCL